MTAPRNAMELPLAGIRAVEASAGTGKTFTLATLYLRLVLEQGLGVDAIVVATFTRAAAAELSERIRQRLVIADALLAEADPATPHVDEDGEHAATRAVIAAALDRNTSLPALRARARLALQTIDTGYIGTLHGFCHRALSEFGFETGQALAQADLIEDLAELETEIVRDFWRRGSANAQTAQLLAATWGKPEDLARQVRDSRWRGRYARVSEPDLAALGKQFAQACQNVAAWDASVQAGFTTELERCVDTANTRKVRQDTLQRLRSWAANHNPDASDFDAKSVATLLPAAIEKLVPKDTRPTGPAFAALSALAGAYAALRKGETDTAHLPACRLLHEARIFLETELPKRLIERNLVGHDQAVDRLAAALVDGERGQQAAARIRTRWKAALVDEFQDTDPRQWDVVRTLFGDTILVLVGDPKQAIYGFRGGDVYAWLSARRQAQGEALRLAESWRAGKRLCQALNALFSRPGAFIEAGIEHPDIHAAQPVAQRVLLENGEPLPALEFWRLDPEVVGHAAGKTLPSKVYAQPAIERACVAWIAGALHGGRFQLQDGHGALQALRPKHIAVLVTSNAEAHSLQAALGHAGIAASCNLRASVYASDEAADLALLLEALAAPDDVRRARAAHASLLAGASAAVIAATVNDDAGQAELLETVTGWAASVHQHGPLPWLHQLLAAAAPRLLASAGGQRRVANYLQLAELLQEQSTRCFGLQDLAMHFARARASADADTADTARLRLDTDADAVTIATVHAAKGLEYAVVLVPYAVLGHAPVGKKSAKPQLYWHHAADNAAWVAIGAGTDAATVARAKREDAAEEVRKLYVAITRASAHAIVPYGPTTSTQFSALFHLLNAAQIPDQSPLPNTEAGCGQALHALCERADGAARATALPLAGPASPQPPQAAQDARHARAFTRTQLQRDWQTWSFSRLVRGNPELILPDPAPGAGDLDTLEDTTDFHIGGPRFGTAVHAVFEHTDFAAWRGAADVPDAERDLIEHCLRDQGIADANGQATHAVGECIRGALNAALPCALRLAELAPEDRQAEIEFHLALAPTRTAQLYALLHQYGYQLPRSGVAPKVLHGLLTGKIDLTFRSNGRFHIIDWKTNRCQPYDDASLKAEIATHDYDLQWLIYTLALHRWLGQRLADYAYERDMGEVYYLFVRGMVNGRGIHTDRPPRALIEAMDALFTRDEDAA